MGALFVKIWGGARRLIGLLVPFVGKARDLSGWGTALRWAVRLLLIVALVVLLYLVNRHPYVQNWWTGPAPLTEFYLPVLFLVLLAWVWLGWYFWKLLTEEEVSDFPDIDAAWEEAMAALDKAGIAIKALPVFLVLGRTAGDEDALFRAAFPSSKRPLRVRGAPQRFAPLHVYATEKAVYVTCAGASVLGRQAERLLLGEGAPARPSPGESGAAEPMSGTNIFATMQPGGQPGELEEMLIRAAREKRRLTPEELDKMHRLQALKEEAAIAPQAPAKRLFLRDEAEVAEQAARLEHLCRLIVRARQPDLPVRGVLVLLPWVGTETAEAANAITDACRRDLAAASALGVVCPRIVLVSDLETAPGFREFVDCFQAEERRRWRAGRSYPLAPDTNDAAGMVRAGLRRFCLGEFTTWMYSFFHLEADAAADPAAVTAKNVNLYQMLVQVLERRERLVGILQRAFAQDPCMLGGCYLAGTGQNAEEQAFVAAVFHRLIEEQETCSWTRRARASDERERRWGLWGLVGVGAAVALAVAYVVVSVVRK